MKDYKKLVKGFHVKSNKVQMTCCRQDLESQGAKMQWKKYFNQGIN